MRSSRPATSANRREAFDALLGEGRPGFVPRSGATVGEVATIVRAAGGIASLAHPGLMRLDDAIPGFRRRRPAGHRSVAQRSRRDGERTLSKRIAEQLGIGMSGGSDYHADSSHHPAGLGTVTLPRAAFADLEARASQAA